MSQPDLRTLSGAMSFLDYKSPDPDTRDKHERVNLSFQELITNIWDAIPDGPGKTVAIRAIGDARMACNSAIANEGM